MASHKHHKAEYDEEYCRTWMFGRAWYLANGAVIILGYAAGGLLSFGIQYLGFLPHLADPSRSVLVLFGIGMLGAVVNVSYFFAHDANGAMYYQEQKPPNCVDPILYAVWIIGGGVAGLLFLAAVKAGIFLTASSSVGKDIRPTSAILIAFSGGLTARRVHTLLAGIEIFDRQKDSDPPKPT